MRYNSGDQKILEVWRYKIKGPKENHYKMTVSRMMPPRKS